MKTRATQKASSPVDCNAGYEDGKLRPSIGSSVDVEAGMFSRPTFARLSSMTTNLSGVTEVVRKQTKLGDHHVLSVTIILMVIFVATFCGIAAFLLHMSVYFAGCLGGLNGCSKQKWLDVAESYGIPRSVYFIITSSLSGLVCSLVICAPFRKGVASKCRGGGSAGTKIVISSGQHVSGWVPVLRIALAAIYMGGGNTLGTEGPIIHSASSLATWIVRLMGIKRRKMLSMFAVVGAAAGISAGSNVLITGMIFSIEELTRSLSRKSALFVTLAAGVAIVIKDRLELLLGRWIQLEHENLVPDPAYWEQLSYYDVHMLFILCIPIGILNGIVGWVFARSAWRVQVFLNPKIIGKSRSYYEELLLPERSHLAIIGFVSACLGSLVYETTGVNGVWGTTISAIREAIRMDLSWDKVGLLFLAKFIAMTLATAGGGPGGTLVPSLVSGGFLGIVIGRMANLNEASVASCAIIGMGSLFSSVMHMPVTGIIIIFELTLAKSLVVHVVLANFIASNVCSRLPGGYLSYVHQVLEHDSVWLKLGGQDFIETDEQEKNAVNTVGVGRIQKMETSVLKWWFMTRDEKLRAVFSAWRQVAVATGTRGRQELAALGSQHKRFLRHWLASVDEGALKIAWSAWLAYYISSLRRKYCTPKDMQLPTLLAQRSGPDCRSRDVTPIRSPYGKNSAALTYTDGSELTMMTEGDRGTAFGISEEKASQQEKDRSDQVKLSAPRSSNRFSTCSTVLPNMSSLLDWPGTAEEPIPLRGTPVIAPLACIPSACESFTLCRSPAKPDARVGLPK